MSTQRSKAVREALARDKAAHLRQLANASWGQEDLLEIFGLGIVSRLRSGRGQQAVGKNFFSNHFHAGARNPAGSKLLRRFIRRSKKEQHVYRKAYAELTGRQYDHLNNPDMSNAEQPT